MERRIRYSLLSLVLLTAAWAAAIEITGGFVRELGGLRLSSRSSVRPLLAASLVLAYYVFRYGRSATLEDSARIGRWLIRPRVVALTAALTAFVVGIAYGSHVVGGSDSYGYVSQAALWLQGNLVVEQSFVGDFPWPKAALTMTPLGHIPTGRAGDFVPMYPPGFPLTLAPFMAVSDAAVFLVVPLFGALAIWLTFQLGRDIEGDTTGALAAVLLLASPAFLFMLISAPMSDIPALSWWLLAAVAALRHNGRRGYLILSGAATTLAVLTRPNLAPLAMLFPPLIWFTSNRSTAVQNAASWLLPALVGPLALAALNASLYGSPFNSGYGSVVDEFSWAHIWPNVKTYFGWLIDSQTPFVLVGASAPLLMHKARAFESRGRAWWCLAFAALVAAMYLPYTVFGVWWFLRFLLPAYPMLLVTAAAAAVLVSRRLGRIQVIVLGLLAVLLVTHGLVFARRELVFSLADGERRYQEAGERARALPPNVIVIASQHSGSLRYYADVLTLRYDTMPPEWLDKAIEHLSERGHPVVAMLEVWEEDWIRAHFGSSSTLDWLRRGPTEITPRGVRMYEVAARAEPRK